MTFELPVDVFLAVFAYLSVEDIRRVRQTCRSFYDITQLRSLWHALLSTHVLNHDIPIPGLSSRTIESLTAHEIERYTDMALGLRRNWTSPSPSSTRKIEIPGASGSRVIYLHFLPRRGGQLLLSVVLHTNSAGRLFTLQCWDMQASPPICIASRSMQQFKGIAFNQNPTSAAIVAIKASQIEVLAIDFAANNPASAFIVRAIFPDDTGGLHGLSGSQVLTQDGAGHLHVWNIEMGPANKSELQNTESPQNETPISTLFHEDLVIVARPSTLEIYPLFSLTSSTAARDNVIHPVLQYRWPWRIDSVVLAPQRQQLNARRRAYSPIGVLIRFGSLFPWPINLLHHYELRPNIRCIPGENNYEVTPPYHFPPSLREMIGSPVRLFATSDMTLGPYGTAVWFDSHTEDHFGHSNRGQRLAARFSPALLGENDEEQLLSDQNATTAANSVFAFCEEDRWIRVALEEEEGRIAVGSNTGAITIFDYAHTT